MRHRPLMVCCLGVFVLIAVLTLAGKGRFIKELRSSLFEEKGMGGEDIEILGSIYKKEYKSDYQLLYLKDITILNSNQPQQLLQESRLIIYDDMRVQVSIGNTVHTNGQLTLMERARNPGNFDEKRYWQRQGIQAKLWAESVKPVDRKTVAISEGLFQFREKWKAALYESIGREGGAVMSGIMLGDKTGMDAELKELYQVNGIGHILAISGLHLSVIGLGTYRLLRKISGSYAVAGAAGIFFLLCYIFMIGMTVSAVRALIMFLFRVGADMTGRHYDAPTAFSAALAVIIFWRPLYIYDGGFWLSFGAVLGALAVVPLFQGRFLQGVWASIGINLIILPILLYFFYEFPCYSVLLNLWIIPLLSILLLLGMAGSALLLVFSPLGNMVLSMCNVILWIYERSCEMALSLPGARMISGQPPFEKMIVYYFLLGVVLYLWCKFGYKVKIINLLLIFALCSIVMFILKESKPDTDQLEVTMLDVGQGDGIFIQSPEGSTYFIDGGSSDVKQVGKYRIEPFLKWKGIQDLDYVMVSHGDADHMNGIEEMLGRRQQGIAIQNLVLPPERFWDKALERLAEIAQSVGTKVLVMEAGTQLGDKEFVLTSLHPARTCEESDGNEASMVLQLKYRAFDLLLTGDIEGEGEQHLLETELSTVDVLKVAHHGSKNSSSEEILRSLNPSAAWISAGKNNRYGHPHKETMERLKSIGCNIYSTQNKGAVMLVTDGNRMKVSEFSAE